MINSGTNRIHTIYHRSTNHFFSTRVAPSFHVHIDEVNLYSRDYKNALTFRTKGCSLIEVLLYYHTDHALQ